MSSKSAGQMPYIKLLMLAEKYLPHYLFLLLAFFLPLAKAITSITVTALFVLAILALRQKERRTIPRQSLPLILGAGVFVLMLLSLLWTHPQNLSEGIRFVNREFAFLALPVLLIVHREWLIKFGRMYIWALVFGTSLAAIVTLLLYWLPEEAVRNFAHDFFMFRDYPERKNRVQFGLYSPFIDRLQFGNLMAVSFLSAIFLSTELTSIRKQIGLWLLAGLIGITILLIGARGAQLGLLAGAVILAIYFYRKKVHPQLVEKVGTTLSSGILVVGLILTFGVFPYLAYQNVEAVSKRWDQMRWEIEVYQNGQYLEYDYLNFSALRRWLSWTNTWTLIKEQPLLGAGIGDYKPDLQEVYDRQELGFPVNSHHQFLFFWAVAGPLAMVLFFGCCLSWLWVPWRDKSGVGPGLFTLSLLLCWGVIMNLDAALIHQINNVSFFLLMGITLFLSKDLTTKYTLVPALTNDLDSSVG